MLHDLRRFAALAMVNVRAVGRRCGIAPDRGGGGVTAEDLAGVKVGGLKADEVVDYGLLTMFAPSMQKEPGFH